MASDEILSLFITTLSPEKKPTKIGVFYQIYNIVKCDLLSVCAEPCRPPYTQPLTRVSSFTHPKLPWMSELTQCKTHKYPQLQDLSNISLRATESSPHYKNTAGYVTQIPEGATESRSRRKKFFGLFYYSRTKGALQSQLENSRGHSTLTKISPMRLLFLFFFLNCSPTGQT